MPNLLVTGRWGETHVTSAQARNFHAGVFGSGQYVLSGLTATMTTANTCHIDPGVACFNGADVEVPAGGVDVTIDNGTQGQKRNDLVVLRYTSEPSTQTESVELAVVKGTPASSDPQDPAHNGGSILEGDSPCDMPLYRIPLDGITVGDPVLLAPAWMAPNRAVVSSADGTPTASAVTATELGYLSGAESSVQGQLDDVRDSLSHLVLGTHITKVEFAYQDEEDWSWEVRLFNDIGNKVYIGFRKDRLVLWDASAQRVIWTIGAKVNG